METDDKSKPVSVAECKRKHGATKWLLAAMITLLGVNGIGQGWTVIQGGSYRVKQVRQEEQIKHVKESVDRVEGEVLSQRKMIEDIWRANGRP